MTAWHRSELAASEQALKPPGEHPYHNCNVLDVGRQITNCA